MFYINYLFLAFNPFHQIRLQLPLHLTLHNPPPPAAALLSSQIVSKPRSLLSFAFALFHLFTTYFFPISMKDFSICLIWWHRWLPLKDNFLIRERSAWFRFPCPTLIESQRFHDPNRFFPLAITNTSYSFDSCHLKQQKIDEGKPNPGQALWWWISWWSGHFQYQRSVVRIPLTSLRI